MQEHFYKKHPNSFIRIDLNRIEPGDDDEANNRYTRAARFYKQWRDEGVLTTEADPAIYVYHQEFTYAGTTYVRRGFMGRQRLTRFGEGQVFPHEETLPAAKVDRLMLTVVTKANLSPIFGLYPDPDCEAQNLLDEAVAGKTPLVATDHLGVVHRLWPVTDVATIAKLSAVMGPKPIFIADGHHRYETACNYRDQIYDSGFLSPEHPANYTLMMCVAMDDPGLIVMPTHRLFRGVPADDQPTNWPRSSIRVSRPGRPAKGPTRPPTVWEDIETGGRQGAIGLYTQKDGRWLIATLTDAGRARMAEVAKDHTEAWQVVGREPAAPADHRRPAGLQRTAQADVRASDRRGGRGLRTGEYPLAAVVMPATVDDVRTISTGRRADAGQEHLLLSEAAQRTGHQSAGVKRGRRGRKGKAEGGACIAAQGLVASATS